MTDKGWYHDADRPDVVRYWDGRRWSARSRSSPGGGTVTRIRLEGWRKLWFQRLVRLPVAFHPLAWLNCSVPVTRGHMVRFIRPTEMRPPRSDRSAPPS